MMNINYVKILDKVTFEVYDQETREWYPGRVEHTTRDGYTGYYFYNSELESPFLHTGMKVRIRKES